MLTDFSRKFGKCGALALLSVVVLCVLTVAPVLAQEKTPFRATDLPLPRFVSLGADKIYVRAGPGTTYPIRWVFNKKSLPVEIVQEYEAWRKIRDSDGQEGWVTGTLLSGRRTVIVKAGEAVELYNKAEGKGRKIAMIESGVVAVADQCVAAWCKIEAGGYHGWMERKFLWGIYEGEELN